MYGVSNSFKTAIKSPAVQSRVSGNIGGGVQFTDANILQGSFSISNQCSGTEQVQIGQVYVGELDITLRGLALNRYTLEGAEITATYELLTGENTWETVPLGVFYVAEANHTAAGLVIKAYDSLSKLDKSAAITTTAGTSYELALMACNACDVELVNTQADFQAFANGSDILYMYAQDDTDIQTWRDFLAWLSQACGCFVTATRDGKIAFRAYGQTVVDTLDTNHRYEGASFSDFETRYTGLYCTDIADQTVTYYSTDPDNGLTYNLGANPFLQFYISEEEKTAQRRAVLGALAVIDYVPFTAELIDNPAYDLGDILSFPGGLGDASKLFCVTKYTWNYHGKMKLEGVGKNPALATAQSKQEKNIEALASRISEDAMHYYDITNARRIIVGDGDTVDIITQTLYRTTKNTHVDFHAEVEAEISTTETESENTFAENDFVGVFTYWLNDVEITDHRPTITETDGVQLRHLLYTFWSEKDTIGYLRVTLTAHGGTVTIPARGITAYLAGQGLVGDTVPEPSFRDDVPPITFELIGSYSDAVNMELLDPPTP